MKSRPASAAPASCTRWNTTRCKPTSSPWPRAWAAACRSQAWWAAPTSWTRPLPAAWAAPTPATRWLAVAAARGAGRHRRRKTVRARRPAGRQARAHLEGLRAKVPGIADVRGLGSMVALELNDPATGKPDADAVKRVQARAMERGLILLSCGVRQRPALPVPLTIPDAQFARALDILSGGAQHKHRADHPAGGASPKGLSPPRPDIRFTGAIVPPPRPLKRPSPIGMPRIRLRRSASMPLPRGSAQRFRGPNTGPNPPGD